MLDRVLLDRIIRDSSDAVLVLDSQGEIAFCNPSAQKLLEIDNIQEKESYASVILDDIKEENDAFFQFLLNAVYEKDKSHKGEVRFITRQGHTKYFYMHSSFVLAEDGETQEGILMSFTDVTEVVNLRKKTYDSALVFVVMMACVCIWPFISVIWAMLDLPISSSLMTKVVEFFGFVVFYIFLRHTSITIEDMGLDIRGAKKYILVDSLFTLAAALIMILIKVILLKTDPSLFPEKTLFTFATWDWSCTLYPISVVAQEFLTRGVIHGSVKRIIPEPHSDFWAILVSSLFFGALHLHKGIYYMVGAFVLLSLFGLVYRKQKTIWGLCIPHYVLGSLLVVLFGL